MINIIIRKLRVKLTTFMNEDLITEKMLRNEVLFWQLIFKQTLAKPHIQVTELQQHIK